MSPSILVEDRVTNEFVKAFTKSEQLTNFLTSEKKSGVDIESKYLVYKFSVNQMFCADEALDTIKTFGYLATNSEYED
jgi:hypothetical protein